MTFPHRTDLLLSAAELLSVLLPGALICLLPTKKWLILSIKKQLLILFPTLILLSFLCALAGCGTVIHSRWFLYPIILAGFFYCLFLIRLERSKIFYLYLCMIAALSFGDLASQMMESFLNADLPKIYLPKAGLIVQWCFSLLALLYFIMIRKHLTWVLENFHTRSVWRFVWAVPAVILFCNVMMASMNPSILLRYKLFRVYLTITGALVFLFGAFQLLFYQIAQAAAERYEAEKLSQLFEAQTHQYHALQNYIEQTHRLQHDLKHVVRTIHGLADTGQYDQLRQFTVEYEQSSRNIFASPHFFCEHMTLNALLGYYADQAKEAQISIDWKVDVPANLPLSDVDLNMIFGNLLENALNACSSLPAERRHIRLSADRNTPNSLYIVMVNSFDGKRKPLHRGNESKEIAPRHGIGLTSVIATAEKYNGIAQFYSRDALFHSNVMIPLESFTPGSKQ